MVDRSPGILVYACIVSSCCIFRFRRKFGGVSRISDDSPHGREVNDVGTQWLTLNQLLTLYYLNKTSDWKDGRYSYSVDCLSADLSLEGQS
jgi:hypothetical protein